MRWKCDPCAALKVWLAILVLTVLTLMQVAQVLHSVVILALEELDVAVLSSQTLALDVHVGFDLFF